MVEQLTKVGTRYGGLRRALLLLAVLHCVTVTGAAAPPQADPYQLRLDPIAEGVYVAIRPESTRQPVMGNGTVIVNDDHVVVVDGNGSALLADRVIAAIRAVTDLPVRYLVVTHWHGDHNLGSHRYLTAWPELEIISHRFAAKPCSARPWTTSRNTRSRYPSR